jgi:hypothetical protein
LHIPSFVQESALRNLNEEVNQAESLNEVLGVEILTYDDETQKYYGGQVKFSFDLIYWKEDGFCVKLDIEEPLMISKNSNSDKVSINILNEQAFISKSSNRTYNSTSASPSLLNYEMPAQVGKGIDA